MGTKLKLSIGITRLLAIFGVAVVLASASIASALEVSGVNLDETARVNDQELTLNGAGIRYKVIFKVYVAGLYLAEKKHNLTDIIALPGAKRVTMVMLRNVDNDSFSQAFLDGIRKNSDTSEVGKIINQMMIFGHMFAAVPEGLKKGDKITADWIPGSGTLCKLNGRQLSEFIPDVAFYNALLKIWLGRNPVDSKLKTAMLGENP
jgi:hypothetical protein